MRYVALTLSAVAIILLGFSIGALLSAKVFRGVALITTDDLLVILASLSVAIVAMLINSFYVVKAKGGAINEQT